MVRLLESLISMGILATGMGCTVTKPAISQCLLRNSETIDLDQDGRISLQELENLIGRLGWIQRSLAMSMGGPMFAMEECDPNQDGYIDWNEFNRNDSCLRSCWSLEQFSKLVCY